MDIKIRNYCYGSGCCCSCKFHVPDHSHPCTDGGAVTTFKGWICMPVELGGIAFSGWSGHGQCELYQNNGVKLSEKVKESK